MTDMKCPNCGCTDFEDYSIGHSECVEGRFISSVDAFVCANCGRVELYAKQDILNQKRAQAQKQKEVDDECARIDAQIAAKIVATMVAAAEAQNEYYGFALYTWTDFLLYDVDSWTYETLDPETEYTVVSAYLDEDGNLLESVVKAEFKTLELVLIDLTFDFAADDEGITITPSDLEATYEYIIVSKAYYEDEEGFNSDADALAEAWYAYVGMDYAVSGVASTTYAYEQLQPNTEYVCACFGVNSGINSAVALFTFTTPEDSETGFEGTQSTEIRGQKMIINGQLFIIRDGKTFNAQGAEVK